MFQTATHESIPRETPIFEEGQKSNDKCYVVLSGRCAVFRAESFNVNPSDISNKKSENQLNMSLSRSSSFQGDDKKLMPRLMIYGELLAFKKLGDQFGETALLTNANRNATIVAVENCELMVFHKSSLDLIKASYSKDIEVKRAFIVGLIPEMGAVNNPIIVTKLIEYFRPKRFQKGEMLTVEGQSGNTFYLIEEGDIVVSKSIPLPRVVKNNQIEYQSKCVQLTLIQDKCIVGEECLSDSGTYSYTISVKSRTLQAYVCEKTYGSTAELSEVFKYLLRTYKSKE